MAASDGTVSLEMLNWLVANQERAVRAKHGRKPSNRPLLLFPSGAVRVEFMGTYPTLRLAAEACSWALGERWDDPPAQTVCCIRGSEPEAATERREDGGDE